MLGDPSGAGEGEEAEDDFAREVVDVGADEERGIAEKHELDNHEERVFEGIDEPGEFEDDEGDEGCDYGQAVV